jgi:hypothetical protein
MNPDDAELRAEANRVKRIKRFPRDARCEVCGTWKHLAWTPDGGIHCYEHIRRAMSPTEAHHLAGRVNFEGLTVELRPNAHRRIHELRSMLGIDAWPEGEDAGPLVGLAHLLAGVGSLLMLLAEWLLALAVEIEERIEAWTWDGLQLNPIE